MTLLYTLTAEQISYIAAAIVCTIIAVACLGMHFFFRYRRENTITIKNSKQEGIWEFTKRNIWMFLFLAFAVFAFALFMMLAGA